MRTIVVGLGAMGSATVRALAARGAEVVGIDRFLPPHDRGSTHGDTRITRLSIGEGAEYVPLVMRAHELWRELEHESGATLLREVGGLVLARPDNPFLQDTRGLAQRFGIAHERLSNAELRRRFPMFAVDEATEGYLEPTAGYVHPEAAVETQLALAERDGAELMLGERVRGWTATPSGVRVTTDAATYDADQLVLSAGAWIGELCPPLAPRVAIHRQVLHWLEIRRGHDALAALPIFIWELGEVGARGIVHLSGFYGFPALDGPDGGMKIATESYETTIAPGDGPPPPTDAERAAIFSDYVAQRLPWLGPRVVRSVSCLYTCVPGNRFLIDRHPDHENVLIVSPCSGHGFKHSPAIGEAVAQWLCDGAPRLDLSPFAL